MVSSLRDLDLIVVERSRRVTILLIDSSCRCTCKLLSSFVPIEQSGGFFKSTVLGLNDDCKQNVLDSIYQRMLSALTEVHKDEFEGEPNAVYNLEKWSEECSSKLALGSESYIVFPAKFLQSDWIDISRVL